MTKQKEPICKCGCGKLNHIIDRFGRTFECKKCNCRIFRKSIKCTQCNNEATNEDGLCDDCYDKKEGCE